MEPKYNMINFDKLIKHSNRKTLSLAQPCPHLRLSPSVHQRNVYISCSLEGELEDELEDRQTRSARKKYQPMSTTEKDIFEKEKRSILEQAGALSLDGAEAYPKYCGPKGENEEATTSGANMNFDRMRLATERMLAMFAKDVKDAAWKDLQAMSDAEKRKYGAGTSKGKERMEGDGEDERKYGAGTSKGKERMEGDGEDEDPRSLPKEELKDDELQTPIPRAEGRERNSARADERECDSARREQKLFERLGSGVIIFGKIAAPYVLTYLLHVNAVKKFDGIALQIKAANEAKVGTTGSASPVSFILNMFNVSISAIPRFAWNSSEKRGNDVEVSGSK